MKKTITFVQLTYAQDHLHDFHSEDKPITYENLPAERILG